MAFDVEKMSLQIEQAFIRFDTAELSFIKPLAELLQKDPDKAIDLIVDTYNKALDDAYTKDDGENVRAFIESIAGGPFEAIPWALYNAVGTVYPFLERKQKDKALGKILNILDGRNCGEVQDGHTTGIREPLLLSDICIARWLYFPGLAEGQYLIKQYDNFYDFQKDLINENGIFKHKPVGHDMNKSKGVNSDFLVAYSLLRSDVCDWGESYIKIADPDFLQRTLKGIIAIIFSYADSEDKFQFSVEDSERLLPKSLHERIEPVAREQDWAEYKKFR